MRDMMIGFGDHMLPMEESIIVMQDFVVEYIQCMVRSYAMNRDRY